MIPLIDCDVLRYEIGSCGQFVDEDTGELVIREFDFVSELFDQRVREICEEVMADEPPLLFLTSDPKLIKMVNRVRKSEGRPELTFVPNFREGIATVKPYKGNRTGDKPYHFDNLTAYISGLDGLRVANGMEADDLMAIYQSSGEKETVICSRDKDLKMVPGWHYSWPCGKQPAWGPEKVDEIGRLDEPQKGKALKGTGLKFFYSQLLTGDTVDNIPGCPKVGPVKAYEMLVDMEDEKQLAHQVYVCYNNYYGDDWLERINEQGQLLWMKRTSKDVWTFPSTKD